MKELLPFLSTVFRGIPTMTDLPVPTEYPKSPQPRSKPSNLRRKRKLVKVSRRKNRR